MIDTGALLRAYKKNGFYSLQLEIGDKCFQNCLYCYMNALPNEKNTLSDAEISSILEDCHELGFNAVEWLGGEPLLRNSIFDHMEHAKELRLRNNIWTGGLPLIDDEIAVHCVDLAKHGLISVHLSTTDPDLYEQLHPRRTRKDIRTILDAVENVLDLGYPPSQMLNSVTFTGLQHPEDMIKTIDLFENLYGIFTSLNVYHTYLRPGSDPGDLNKFIPKAQDVAKVFSRLKEQTGENLPMNCVNKQYCSTTVAVLSDGSVTPCATIREEIAPNIHEDRLGSICQRYRDHLTISKFRSKDNLPDGCKNCIMTETCFGCRARAFSSGKGIYGLDPRCFRSSSTFR
jgi:radical SAM protein with 4Fe4S-binding SPASM domain